MLEDPNRYSGRVSAPNIKNLAACGVKFRRAYTASPVCLPSRTALWSGVSPAKSDTYYNGMRTEYYRYTRYSKDQEELYHVTNDPQHFHNLIESLGHKDALESLRKRVPTYEEMAKPMGK